MMALRVLLVLVSLQVIVATSNGSEKIKLPLDQSEETIREALLTVIPIGSSYTQVKRSLEESIEILSMNTVINSHVRKPSGGLEFVQRRIYANLGELPTGPVPVVIQVKANFDFDENDQLREIEISKRPHGP
jgi:hypothetical protein